MVGREAELAQLHELVRESALQGERQIVFVTGEPGIGKTTLVEAFLRTARRHSTQDARCGWGGANASSSTGRAKPTCRFLEALGAVVSGAGRGAADRPAASTCADVAGADADAAEAAELEALQRKVQGATRERMLREMAEALDAITAERPLVLWLEDLHWSDVSTLDCSPCWRGGGSRRVAGARHLSARWT